MVLLRPRRRSRMRAYSMDLRERVFRDSDAGMTSVAVAEKFDVSRAWVDRLKQRRRETGEVAPRAQRYGPHPKLGPHLHRLADLIHEQPDRTLAELQEALAGCRRASPRSGVR